MRYTELTARARLNKNYCNFQDQEKIVLILIPRYGLGNKLWGAVDYLTKLKEKRYVWRIT